jgi:hypothetical protein
VRICFLFLMIPTKAVSGRYKLIRVERRTATLRLRASIDGILFLDEENILNVREINFINYVLSFNVSSRTSTFYKLKR